jgi:hypothetical protein
MPFGSAINGLSEGLQSGVGLMGALQQQKMQQAQLQRENFQNMRMMNTTPTEIGGQTFQLNQDDAAKYANERASRVLMGQMMMNKIGAQQDFNSGKLTPQEQNRLDATQSAVPVHNAAMALYQAYQDTKSPDPSVSGTAMSILQKKLAGNQYTRGFAEQVGNNPANIPALYDSVITQGSMEQPKLATGSVYVPGGEELEGFKKSFYPGLEETPDVAYGKFKHFTDAYIKPAYDAGLQRLSEASDGKGNFSNPYLGRTYARVKGDYDSAMGSLYQMPGFGAKGTAVPEMKGAINEMSGGGVPAAFAPGPGGIPSALTGNAPANPYSGSNIMQAPTNQDDPGKAARMIRYQQLKAKAGM